jgi:predicted TIM-barrel fold metal-dependent hydrolase
MDALNSSRRWFLRAACGLAATGTGMGQERVHVPWSAGEERPRSKAPADATDCHHHIYDSRFPADPKAQLRPGDATVADYRLLQKRIGTTRNVIVQPSTYGLDNRCMLNALRQFGKSRTRGVAVVDTSVSDRELRELGDAGVRGIRFNLLQAGATTIEMVKPLARRVAGMGWHIQVNASPEQIVAAMKLWKELPAPIVFDHIAHVVRSDGAAFAAMRELLAGGKCWVKLSGAYMDTRVGPPSYADRGAVARAYLKESPERLVWGTDWPHPTATEKPDDAVLFDLLAKWCGSEALRRRVFVENPTRLYGF